MKVVHIATTDLGGSYKAANRIKNSMNLYKTENILLLRTKYDGNNDGIEVINTPWKKLISKIKNVGNLLQSSGEIVTDMYGTNLADNSFIRNADVIVLHWVNSFISNKNVEQLIETGKPIIWVMHDMWLFTGGCHYDDFCGKYEFGCGNCPLLSEKEEHDISYKNIYRKRRMLENSNIVAVGPSNWITECAKRSLVLKNIKIECIPNPIDYQIYCNKYSKEELKVKYGINTEKKCVLFGAVKATANKIKGIHYLVAAVSKLPQEEYQVVVFGKDSAVSDTIGGMETKYLGYISSEDIMAEVYSMADVFVAPSVQESFCYTVGEALACKTPVAGFNTGGLKDQIRHKENGYLAEQGNAEDLKDGIIYCIERISKVVEQNTNTFKMVGKKYCELCERMTSKVVEKEIIKSVGLRKNREKE